MSDSVLLNATQRLSTMVASRTSRRSFIGRASTAALAATATATVFADPATAALRCDTCSPGCQTGCTDDRTSHCGRTGHSVTCAGLTGTGGACPPYTVACGSWACLNCSKCGGNAIIWTDCCAIAGQCEDPTSCRCVTDTDGVTAPTCCYGHCYSGGGVGCNHIVCRYEHC